jgi:hypothetical protein
MTFLACPLDRFLSSDNQIIHNKKALQAKGFFIVEHLIRLLSIHFHLSVRTLVFPGRRVIAVLFIYLARGYLDLPTRWVIAGYFLYLSGGCHFARRSATGKNECGDQ